MPFQSTPEASTAPDIHIAVGYGRRGHEAVVNTLLI